MRKVSTADRLREIMYEKNLKQVDIINLCKPYCDRFNAKLQKSDLSQYLSGKVEPSQYKLTILGMALGVSESWLMGYDVPKERDDDDSRPAPDEDVIDLSKLKNVRRINPRRFPLLGKIACGQPILAVEEHDSYVIADRDIDADFCVIAKGDSMIGARIYDGDIIFIKRMPIVENGEIAAVVIDDEVTLKRVFYNKESETVSLIPENLKYDPLVYHNSQLDLIHFLGKAVYFMGPVK